MKKAIIFDLDNTLLDTTVLMPYVEAIKKAKTVQEREQLWFEHDSVVHECTLYEGMNELWQNLKERGIMISIVSNSVKRRIKICTSMFGYTIDPKLMIGRYSIIPRVPILKPDARLFLKAASLMGVEPKDILTLGNESVDIITSQNSGMDSVACRWGANDIQWEDMLIANPTYQICNPLDVLNLL